VLRRNSHGRDSPERVDHHSNYRVRGHMAARLDPLDIPALPRQNSIPNSTDSPKRHGIAACL